MDATQLTLFPEPKVYALYSSVMGSGKSEVAKVLTQRHGFKLIKFAGPFKDMTRVLLGHMGIPSDQIEKYVEGELKEVPIPGADFSTRYVMQTLGTEWRDLLDRNLWVKMAVQSIQRELSRGRSVVIDDMRFPHEYSALTQLPTEFVRVIRMQTHRRGKPHASEGALDGHRFNHTIINDWTLDDLRATVEKTLGLAR